MSWECLEYCIISMPVDYRTYTKQNCQCGHQCIPIKWYWGVMRLMRLMRLQCILRLQWRWLRQTSFIRFSLYRSFLVAICFTYRYRATSLATSVTKLEPHYFIIILKLSIWSNHAGPSSKASILSLPSYRQMKPPFYYTKHRTS